VNEAEIENIARQSGISADEFRARHTRPAGARRSLLEKENGDCEFLARDTSGKTRCSIYAVRPAQCRTWPFWKSNLASERAWRATGRVCPGIDQGQHYALPVIQDGLRKNELVDAPL
jgi:Fe-S-cluster containining protein